MLTYLTVSPEVRSALPAIDARAPPSRPHVALKLKQCQRELERTRKIQRDNFGLLQRLNAIMRVNRLDNHWPKPLPNFQQKVGLFYDAMSLRSRVTARSAPDESSVSSYHNVKCYACDLKKKHYEFKMLELRSPEDLLPSIF
ncbi:uncharacterized protein LOC135087984 [Ostrinia nubilalis]|uniref:uncharacterized protein LOC135087984 n=1 Tax=Ostrinia nubilalis TaxID=29057 RepID=UPI0030824F03